MRKVSPHQKYSYSISAGRRAEVSRFFTSLQSRVADRLLKVLGGEMRICREDVVPCGARREPLQHHLQTDAPPFDDRFPTQDGDNRHNSVEHSLDSQPILARLSVPCILTVHARDTM